MCNLHRLLWALSFSVRPISKMQYFKKNSPWSFDRLLWDFTHLISRLKTICGLRDLKDTFFSTLQIICLFSLLCWLSTAVSFSNWSDFAIACWLQYASAFSLGRQKQKLPACQRTSRPPGLSTCVTQTCFTGALRSCLEGGGQELRSYSQNDECSKDDVAKKRAV